MRVFAYSTLLLAALAFLVLYPTAMLLIGALTSTNPVVEGYRFADLSVVNFLTVLANPNVHYALINTLVVCGAGTAIAGTIGLTGSDAGGASLGGQVQPGNVKATHGAIVSKALGFAPAMPRFVTMGGRLHQGKRPITGEGGGPLGSLHDPFRLDYDPELGVKLPQLDLPDGFTANGLTDRRRLRQSLDEMARRFDQWPQMERLDRFRQQAFSLLTSTSARD